MKSFKNFYSILPETPQKEFKKRVMKVCGWNDDQFYKKMRGATKIFPPEVYFISIIANQYSKIFKLARQISIEIDQILYEEEVKTLN
ncbi:MAG: hypothetical protein PHX80_05350 [Candidatus Nanoarchaeia archaeon]|nr:hypothetical protein [Candidatus Nanoarchaeia archaeon]